MQQLLTNIAIREKLERTQDLMSFNNVPTSTGVRSFYFHYIKIGLHDMYL
jgi:hypothetical protein